MLALLLELLDPGRHPRSGLSWDPSPSNLASSSAARDGVQLLLDSSEFCPRTPGSPSTTSAFLELLPSGRVLAHGLHLHLQRPSSSSSRSICFRSTPAPWPPAPCSPLQPLQLLPALADCRSSSFRRRLPLQVELLLSQDAVFWESTRLSSCRTTRSSRTWPAPWPFSPLSSPPSSASASARRLFSLCSP